MTWPRFWTSSSSAGTDTKTTVEEKVAKFQEQAEGAVSNLQSSTKKIVNDVAASDQKGLLNSLTQPTTLVSTALLTTAILSLVALQRRYARRIPNATSVPQTYILPLQQRFSHSLFGRVTSVGDADNFRLYHTPLGFLGLWHTLRHVPKDTKQLKNKTIHIRLAGIDAPELSHFGRPAQRFSSEALEWLTAYIKGRRVRCHVHKADQYGRVVATVYVRKGLLRRDVGLQMLRAGLATVYEAKSGAEFGSKVLEEKYRSTEQWAKSKSKGMWNAGKLESPREYKNRFREGSPNT